MDIRKKIALFCNVNINAVIESMDASTIYDVPLLMLKEQLDKTVLTKLKLSHKNEPNLDNWKDFLGRLKNPTSEVKIGLVGKYVELPDAYKSIIESFIHAGAKNECKVKVQYIPSEQLTVENAVDKLKGLHGVLVAPGFGERGFEGKIEAIRYVRQNNIPFFGICLGMQCAVVEFGRNVLRLTNASSTEMNQDTPHPVIAMMEDQKNYQ
jgi:CTP synthase